MRARYKLIPHSMGWVVVLGKHWICPPTSRGYARKIARALNQLEGRTLKEFS